MLARKAARSWDAPLGYGPIFLLLPHSSWPRLLIPRSENRRKKKTSTLEHKDSSRYGWPASRRGGTWGCRRQQQGMAVPRAGTSCRAWRWLEASKEIRTQDRKGWPRGGATAPPSVYWFPSGSNMWFLTCKEKHRGWLSSGVPGQQDHTQRPAQHRDPQGPAASGRTWVREQQL